MYFKNGQGYFASSNLETSTANQEIIQQYKPSDWNTKLLAYKFSFINDQECHVKINEVDKLMYCRAGQKFEIDRGDNEIWSFVIVEPNITYNIWGAY